METARDCQRFHVGKLIGPLLIILIALASSVFATPPLIITDAGYYFAEVGSDGVPELIEVERIVDLRDGAGPPPKEPPELGPPPDGISKDVARWAAAVGDPEGAQVYALVFETVRDGLKSKSLEPSGVFRVLRESADDLIGDEWEPVRENLGDYFTARKQEGALSERIETANKMELIRYGLVYSAREANPLPMGEAVQVIAKVNEIIEGGK
jgi:hypothetical protein